VKHVDDEERAQMNVAFEAAKQEPKRLRYPRGPERRPLLEMLMV
jgi:hypothetical protein